MRVAPILAVVLVFAAPGADARAHRSEKVKADFQRANPCPATGQTKGKCPGYVIDHVYPLACGGLDDPLNLMWQTVRDAKIKDRWERKGCQSAGRGPAGLSSTSGVLPTTPGNDRDR
jgi:hypothetical protein